MTLRSLLSITLLAFFLTGCMTVKPMAPELSSNLKNADVAVAFVTPDQKLHYNEDVYKVLWIENRANAASYKGFWDADKEVAKLYAQKFKSYGVRTSSIHGHFNESDYQKLVNQVGMLNITVDPDVTLNLDESLRSKLEAQGIGYLIVFQQNPLRLKADSWFSALTMTWSGLIYMVDISTGKTAHRTHDGLYYRYEYKDFPREIEKNKLAGLKMMVSKALENQFTPTRIPHKLGL